MSISFKNHCEFFRFDDDCESINWWYTVSFVEMTLMKRRKRKSASSVKIKKKLNVDTNDCRSLADEDEKRSSKSWLIRRKRADFDAFFNLKNVSSIEKLSSLSDSDFCADTTLLSTFWWERKNSVFLYDLITLQKLRKILTKKRNWCHFSDQFVDSLKSSLTVKRNEWVLNLNERK